MGSYLNPRSAGFQASLNSQIYVDKSGLIRHINRLINTQRRYVCISRPRRFGKSMAADMLAAYYGCGEDTRPLFDSLKIASDPSYPVHINRYNVLKINMQEFLSITKSVEEMLRVLEEELVRELSEVCPGIRTAHLIWALKDAAERTGRPFIILIDEWDCLFREYQDDKDSQKDYLDFLRAWLKDQPYVGLAYMTGILPVKKYGTHSALNMFAEYSMTSPGNLAEYFGFTQEEVQTLCAQYGMNFEEARAWYDGYGLEDSGPEGVRVLSMYSPKSVVEAMLRHRYDTYWNQTETYEALKIYIQRNEEGLRDAVIRMLAGERIPIDIHGFSNDMTTFHCADDVLQLLVHLGYLTYCAEDQTAAIPNKEVSTEYVTAIKRMDGWGEVMRSVEASRELLHALWKEDGDAVAEGIDRAHDEISILKYNDENSLSCAISLAFYYAREYYTLVREMPAGKGYADLCLIPRKLHADKPAVIIELKKDESPEGAIRQIRGKEYGEALSEYRGNLLLCGISYGKDKKHRCVIEKMEKKNKSME